MPDIYNHPIARGEPDWSVFQGCVWNKVQWSTGTPMMNLGEAECRFIQALVTCYSSSSSSNCHSLPLIHRLLLLLHLHAGRHHQVLFHSCYVLAALRWQQGGRQHRLAPPSAQGWFPVYMVKIEKFVNTSKVQRRHWRQYSDASHVIAYARGPNRQFFGQISAQILSKILNVWVEVWTKHLQKRVFAT